MRKPPKGKVSESSGLWSLSVGERPHRVNLRERGAAGGAVSVDYSYRGRRWMKTLGFSVRDSRGWDTEAITAAERTAKDVSLGMELHAFRGHEDAVPLLHPDHDINAPEAKRARKAATERALREWENSGNRHCQVCGWTAPRVGRRRLPGLNVHHVVPVCIGGTDESFNLAIVCANCHAVAHAIWGLRAGPADHLAFKTEILLAYQGATTRPASAAREGARSLRRDRRKMRSALHREGAKP